MIAKSQMIEFNRQDLNQIWLNLNLNMKLEEMLYYFNLTNKTQGNELITRGDPKATSTYTWIAMVKAIKTKPQLKL